MADFTSVLALLLSDSRLRKAFSLDADSTLARFELPSQDRAALLAINAADLERQARGLVSKRRGEVGLLMPQTFALPGEERATALFEAFAETFWPSSHRRHLEDAVAFGAYLKRMSEPLCESEWNTLKFRLNQRRLALHVVSHSAGHRSKRGLQFLARLGGRECNLVFSLAGPDKRHDGHCFRLSQR